jgi:hypothetical protein
MDAVADETDAEQQDWRIQAELHVQDAGGALRELLERLRGPDLAREVEASVPHDVVITHDGELLFAYAADRSTIAAARAAIEAVLAREGIEASIRVSHWEEGLDEWLQTDPPLSADAQTRAAARRRDADAVETRTLVVSSGKLVRAEVEQTMRRWAGKLGVQCEILEHPHLLTTQLAFTVSGPKYKVDEFARGLREEERATIRAERDVMVSHA